MMRVVYGVDDGLPTWEGANASEVGARLVGMGCDGVFLKRLEPRWVEALKAAGLQVFASFGVFIDSSPVDALPLWERWPDSRPVTAAGIPAPQQEWYRPLLPAHPRVRAQRLVQLEALAASLPLDGIWLDFIRWPGRWEQPRPQLYHSSFDAITLRQFQNDTGIALSNASEGSPAAAARHILREHADRWFSWRCQQVVSFVATVRAVLRRRLPHATLGLFAVPWVGSAAGTLSLDGQPVENANIGIWGQDLVQLSQYVDVISPMVYHRLCGQPVAWVADVTGEVGRTVRAEDAQTDRNMTGRNMTGRNMTGRNIALWPVVEAIEGAEHYGAAEFEAVCHAATEKSPPGVEPGIIVFKLAGLLQDEAKIKRWRNLFDV